MGRRIPIIGSTDVDPQFGTGCLKITPGHDPTDFAIGRQNNLPVINIMRDDGHLNGNALAYEGLERFAARKAIWKDLQVTPRPPFSTSLFLAIQIRGGSTGRSLTESSSSC